MKNWAGNLSFFPKKIFTPKNTEEIKHAVEQTHQQKKSLRMMGSGHSWSGLFETNENFMHLDNFQGIIEVKDNLITARSGTKLFSFSKEAQKLSLAMEN